MPHTTSGKKRNKRPDARPNGKERRKQKQRVAAATPVEKLIKTNIPCSKRKERSAGGVLKKGKQHMDPVANLIKSRQKILRQIYTLAEKQNAGAILDDAQLEKLERMDTIVAELEKLLGQESEGEGEEEEDDIDGEERGR
jgi:hypothetical protein